MRLITGFPSLIAFVLSSNFVMNFPLITGFNKLASRHCTSGRRSRMPIASRLRLPHRRPHSFRCLRILSAHFHDDGLGILRRKILVDVHSNLVRAGERHPLCVRMIRDRLSDVRPRTGKK